MFKDNPLLASLKAEFAKTKGKQKPASAQDVRTERRSKKATSPAASAARAGKEEPNSPHNHIRNSLQAGAQASAASACAPVAKSSSASLKAASATSANSPTTQTKPTKQKITGTPSSAETPEQTKPSTLDSADSVASKKGFTQDLNEQKDSDKKDLDKQSSDEKKDLDKKDFDKQGPDENKDSEKKDSEKKDSEKKTFDKEALRNLEPGTILFSDDGLPFFAQLPDLSKHQGLYRFSLEGQTRIYQNEQLEPEISRNLPQYLEDDLQALRNLTAPLCTGRTCSCVIDGKRIIHEQQVARLKISPKGFGFVEVCGNHYFVLPSDCNKVLNRLCVSFVTYNGARGKVARLKSIIPSEGFNLPAVITSINPLRISLEDSPKSYPAYINRTALEHIDFDLDFVDNLTNDSRHHVKVEDALGDNPTKVTLEQFNQIQPLYKNLKLENHLQLGDRVFVSALYVNQVIDEKTSEIFFTIIKHVGQPTQKFRVWKEALLTENFPAHNHTPVALQENKQADRYVDFTDLPFISIDGNQATDLDDLIAFFKIDDEKMASAYAESDFYAASLQPVAAKAEPKPEEKSQPLVQPQSIAQPQSIGQPQPMVQPQAVATSVQATATQASATLVHGPATSPQKTSTQASPQTTAELVPQCPSFYTADQQAADKENLFYLQDQTNLADRLASYNCFLHSTLVHIPLQMRQSLEAMIDQHLSAYITQVEAYKEYELRQFEKHVRDQRSILRKLERNHQFKQLRKELSAKGLKVEPTPFATSLGQEIHGLEPENFLNLGGSFVELLQQYRAGSPTTAQGHTAPVFGFDGKKIEKVNQFSHLSVSGQRGLSVSDPLVLAASLQATANAVLQGKQTPTEEALEPQAKSATGSSATALTRPNASANTAATAPVTAPANTSVTAAADAAVTAPADASVHNLANKQVCAPDPLRTGNLLFEVNRELANLNQLDPKQKVDPEDNQDHESQLNSPASFVPDPANLSTKAFVQAALAADANLVDPVTARVTTAARAAFLHQLEQRYEALLTQRELAAQQKLAEAPAKEQGEVLSKELSQELSQELAKELTKEQTEPTQAPTLSQPTLGSLTCRHEPAQVLAQATPLAPEPVKPSSNFKPVEVLASSKLTPLGTAYDLTRLNQEQISVKADLVNFSRANFSAANFSADNFSGESKFSALTGLNTEQANSAVKTNRLAKANSAPVSANGFARGADGLAEDLPSLSKTAKVAPAGLAHNSFTLNAETIAETSAPLDTIIDANTEANLAPGSYVISASQLSGFPVAKSTLNSGACISLAPDPVSLFTSSLSCHNGFAVNSTMARLQVVKPRVSLGTSLIEIPRFHFDSDSDINSLRSLVSASGAIPNVFFGAKTTQVLFGEANHTCAEIRRDEKIQQSMLKQLQEVALEQTSVAQQALSWHTSEGKAATVAQTSQQTAQQTAQQPAQQPTSKTTPQTTLSSWEQSAPSCRDKFVEPDFLYQSDTSPLARGRAMRLRHFDPQLVRDLVGLGVTGRTKEGYTQADLEALFFNKLRLHFVNQFEVPVVKRKQYVFGNSLDKLGLYIPENTHLLSAIAIADPSYYFDEENPLDLQARKLGQTLYLPEYQVDMLPTDFLDNYASMVPGYTRPALVALIALDKQGNLLQSSIYQARVMSKAQLSYQEVAEYFDQLEQITDLKFVKAPVVSEESASGQKSAFAPDLDAKFASARVEPACAGTRQVAVPSLTSVAPTARLLAQEIFSPPSSVTTPTPKPHLWVPRHKRKKSTAAQVSFERWVERDPVFNQRQDLSQALPDYYGLVTEQVHLLNEFTEIRRLWRSHNNILVQNSSQACQYHLADDGTCADITNVTYYSSNDMVSETMLMYNSVVGSYCMTRGIPTIYLQQNGIKQGAEEAYLETIERIAQVDQGFAHFLTKYPNRQDLLTLVGYNDLQSYILRHNLPWQNQIMRHLDSSFYSHRKTTHIGLGHYGYQTLSSPIRKYTDLFNQRNLKAYLNRTYNYIEPTPQLVDTINENRSGLKRAVRTVQTLLTNQYLTSRLNKSYDAEVRGVVMQGTRFAICASGVLGFTYASDMGLPLLEHDYSLGNICLGATAKGEEYLQRYKLTAVPAEQTQQANLQQHANQLMPYEVSLKFGDYCRVRVDYTDNQRTIFSFHGKYYPWPQADGLAQNESLTLSEFADKLSTGSFTSLAQKHKEQALACYQQALKRQSSALDANQKQQADQVFQAKQKQQADRVLQDNQLLATQQAKLEAQIVQLEQEAKAQQAQLSQSQTFQALLLENARVQKLLQANSQAQANQSAPANSAASAPISANSAASTNLAANSQSLVHQQAGQTPQEKLTSPANSAQAGTKKGKKKIDQRDQTADTLCEPRVFFAEDGKAYYLQPVEATPSIQTAKARRFHARRRADKEALAAAHEQLSEFQ